ncbi:MAG: DEAD/DEAH box helicase [Bacteroidota bacterium]
MKFSEFDLHDEILMGLQDMGFSEATPIQEQAIPIVLEGSDLIACAQTGTGKTAAFLIPTIDILDGISGKQIKTLILCPTRELAMQIDQACEGLAYHTYVSNLAVFGGNKGGNDFTRQKTAIQQGSDIVIATPGRLLQHISLGYVDLSQLEFLILDEADRMLDMGFLADIMRIIATANEDRQTLMFSATMPPKIRQFAKQIMQTPKQVNIAVSKPAEGIKQSAFCVYEKQKIPLISGIFKQKEVESVIVFASRKSSVDKIVKTLQKGGFDARGMHSDRDQSEREKIVNEFKNKQFPIMVATDIMSRGIDIDGLSHVINFDVPSDAEDYVHRIGRTARADKKGEAITFITEDDMRKFGRIEQLIEREVDKPDLPEELGEGPKYNPRSSGRGGGRGYGRKGGGGKGRGKGKGKGRGQGKGRGPSSKSGSGRPGGQGGPPSNRPSNGNQGAQNKPNNKKKRRRGGRRKGKPKDAPTAQNQPTPPSN